MNISTRTGLVGFLLTLAALNVPTATAATHAEVIQSPGQTIESRLNRLTDAIRDRETKLDITPPELDQLVAGFGNVRGGGGFGNVRGGGGFVNRAGGGGFVNRAGGGGFINTHPWRNGWRDGGGFWNRR